MLEVIKPEVDAGSPEGVKKQIKAKRTRERDAAEFYRMVFASPVGRREMWSILMRLHPFERRVGVSPGGQPDHDASVAYAAETQAGQNLWKSWLRLDREGVLKMMDEHDPEMRKPK